MRSTRKHQGFTLMEMLIVVAIIAVLVAIAIPTFSKSLEKSRRAVDLATARDIMAVFAAAVNDGTVELPHEDSCIWVEVHRKALYTGKGTSDDKPTGPQLPTYNGTEINSVNIDTVLPNILRAGGLNPASIRVHSRDTANNGWGWYLVYAKGNGTVGVISGTETNGTRKIGRYPGNEKIRFSGASKIPEIWLPQWAVNEKEQKP